MVSPLAINPAAIVTISEFADGVRCAVVDDFLADPEYVREFALQSRRMFELPERGYPGLTLDVSGESMRDIYRFLRKRMSHKFGFLRGDVQFSSMLAITSLHPAELSNLQRVCHTDPNRQPDRGNFASVLYLFENTDLGGTGFYRWNNRPALEQATALDLQDPRKALGFLQERFAYFRETPRYMTGSNDVADCLGTIPAKFNRLIFYSGDLPHSAYVENPDLLSDDPLQARLTLNCFASVRPLQEDHD